MELSLAALFVSAVVLADDEEEKKDSVGTVIGIDLGTTYSWLVPFVFQLCEFVFIKISADNLGSSTAIQLFKLINSTLCL